MTPVGLNFPVADPIDPALLDQLRAWGYWYARIDLQQQPADITALRAQEVIDHGLQPIVIISHAEQLRGLPIGALPEVGNEPDLEHFGWTLESYIEAAQLCIDEAISQRRKIYVGAISNLDGDSLDFLAELPWGTWPLEYVSCSYHRYPAGRWTLLPTRPHHGFASRSDEMATLRMIVSGARPLACTEVGYHDQRLSEDLAVRYFAWERQFASDQGVEALVAYQINDGPDSDTSDEAHYGFRDFSGAWKARAAKFAEETHHAD